MHDHFEEGDGGDADVSEVGWGGAPGFGAEDGFLEGFGVGVESVSVGIDEGDGIFEFLEGKKGVSMGERKVEELGEAYPMISGRLPCCKYVPLAAVGESRSWERKTANLLQLLGLTSSHHLFWILTSVIRVSELQGS